MRKAVVAALGAVLIGAPGLARAAESDSQQWTVARVNHGFDRNWAFSFSARGRFDDNVTDVRDYTLTPYLSYTAVEGVPLIDDLVAIVGYQRLKSYKGRDEHRIWQSLLHSVDRGPFRVNHRIRLDQRFVQDVGPMIARLRYRVGTSHALGATSWFGTLRNEVFANLNSGNEGPPHGFEQNRTRFGIGRFLGRRLRAEGGYEFQYVRRRGRDVLRHVVFFELSLASGFDPDAVRSGTEAPRADPTAKPKD